MTDAHCHPCDLAACFPGAETERQRLNVVCAASAWNLDSFVYHESLAAAHKAGFRLCFAVHPQLVAMDAGVVQASLDTLYRLVEEKRLDAIGETGFDLYNQLFKGTEKVQDELFVQHLELAISKGLTLVLHIRRAMHKVFAYTKLLRRAPALIFHAWSGTQHEAESLLRRGINAWFSFGASITLNHKEAMRCCARLPAERLLIETDAPYQALRSAAFSRYADLLFTLQAMRSLREEAGTLPALPLEPLIDGNFHCCFSSMRFQGNGDGEYASSGGAIEGGDCPAV
ncbi:MAG: TatD family hydrolase [Treponema sp.]|jgi:TatD DNase family protein|nr:TatD family hydrolase [Treponema sp.]